MAAKTLGQEILEEFGQRAISSRALPDAIVNNLNPKLRIRPYQQKAFQIFDIYAEEYLVRANVGVRQILFHMATGSGKTLIMAGALLDLYRLGYRNFLFFVDSTSIINKTRDNFLNRGSSKYLFATSTSIDGTPIVIQEVDNFQSSNPDAINIVFTTVQGLHTQMTTPRENSLTIDDFRAHDIVLISDEAHHINAESRQSSGQPDALVIDKPSWENTVETIFKANSENILLEFTATMDFDNAGIAAKYTPRLIFDYPLKEFRQDGYSKDVAVLQSETEIIDRALGAVVLSQWRRKIFADHNLNIKPIVLFKSRTIKESEAFQSDFNYVLQKLDAETLIRLRNSSQGLLAEAFAYLSNSAVNLENFALELQEDFSVDKQLSVNSKSATEENQIVLNSLEDKNNEFRAIFAVDMLNEGWDVLNLFDIVRLYDTRDAKNNQVGKTTMSEAQLIGRGARYYPFVISDQQERDKRKFDNDIANPLRLCETLVYHSAYNPRYIQELNSALREIGIVAAETVIREMKLRGSFRASESFRQGYLFVNKLVKKDYSAIHGLESYLSSLTFKHQLDTGFSTTTRIFESETETSKRLRKSFDIELGQINRHILRKALNRNPFFRFRNLKEYLPNLTSVDEFVLDRRYLAGLKVTVEGPNGALEELSANATLAVVEHVCSDIETRMKSQKTEYVGSEDFRGLPMASVLKDKTLNISTDDAGNRELGRSMSTLGDSALYLDLESEDWFSHNDFFGTSEEKHLVHYFKSLVPRLRKHFNEVFLVRNERFFKIYNFSDGAATEPDFFAVLNAKSDVGSISLQVFIEPKGDHLLAHDQWKESFLTEIKNRGRAALLTESNEYLIWGMPFYNKATEEKFAEAFEQVFLVTPQSAD